MLDAKASIPTTSIAGGLFMLKRTKNLHPRRWVQGDFSNCDFKEKISKLKGIIFKTSHNYLEDSI